MMSGKKSLARRYVEGIGILVGMIFGAGVFALPYVTAQSGIAWGAFHLGLALAFMLILHYLYGEVAYYTGGEHRFVGYVRLLLGKRAAALALLLTLFGSYGAMVVYGVLGGVFFSSIVPLFSAFGWALIFFAAGGLLVLMRFEKIGTINFWLSIPLFLFVLVLAFAAGPHIKTENFLTGSGALWFLPYGAFLFSLGGFATIPETRDIFRGVPFRHFRNVIVFSLSLTAIFYGLFVFSVVGINGAAASEDALTGLLPALGRGMFLAGSFIGFLAVFTSFIALASDLKQLFIDDLKRGAASAWYFTVIPAPLLFMFGANNFIKAISIVGALGLGIGGIFIVLMAVRQRARQSVSAGILRYLAWPLVAGLAAASFLGTISVFMH